MVTENNPDALCAEVLADARRKSEQTRQAARAEADAIFAAARAEGERIRGEQRARAEAEAVRRKDLILATVAVEVARRRTARVETILDSMHEEIRRQVLSGSFPSRPVVVALAAEAVRAMFGDTFMLKISAADAAAFGNVLADEVARLVARAPLRLTVSGDEAVTGGVIIQTPDGVQTWDNRLSSRLERLWPELRRAIAVSTSLVEENHESGGGP
ncbi:MAG TPA: V-type ATP synthase subunit E [Verrucomicrobiae bacterium]